jgi:hypothetical protein
MRLGHDSTSAWQRISGELHRFGDSSQIRSSAKVPARPLPAPVRHAIRHGWLVARGSWLVARGSWLVARGREFGVMGSETVAGERKPCLVGVSQVLSRTESVVVLIVYVVLFAASTIWLMRERDLV